jgi:myo-inositol 2-dehydrogenase / D-chiro-inositol 1-dehydrogenase
MRVGIVGAGSMGRAHAAGWRAAGAELVGVVSQGGVSAKALAEAHGARAFADLDALMAEVEVVDLCVPSDLHHPMTLRAAAAGKHVVCEKPIALSLAHADEMIAACERAGVRLFVAHVLRFFPQYRTAAETVRAGHLGRLGVMRFKRVSAPPRAGQASWFADEARSGGMICDLMVHDFDYAAMLGGPVKRVFARSLLATHPDSPRDYALVTLGFESGAMALVEGGWAYPAGVFRTGFDLAGTEGLIEWDSESSESIRRYLLPTGPGETAEVGLPLTVMAEDPYTTEIKHVHDALVHDRPFAVTPREAATALRLGLAARASLRSGRSVDPAEVA